MPLDERMNGSLAGSAVRQKRNLDDFLLKGGGDKTTTNHHTEASSDNKENIPVGIPTTPTCPPLSKSSPALTESGSSPDGRSPSPNPTPTDSPSMTNLLKVENLAGLSVDGIESSPMAPGIPSQPAPKKRRTTEQERAEKKQGKEEAARLKEEAKAAKTREKEEAAKAKEDADTAKAEAKAAKAREKEAANQLKAKAKAEKEQKKAKEERQQLKLTSMLKGTAPRQTAKSEDGPAVNDDGVLSSTDSAAARSLKAEPQELSVYGKMFKPFFVKENVSMASVSVQMDRQMADAKCRIFDEHMQETRDEPGEVTDWVKCLQIPGKGKRGRIPVQTVRDILADAHGNGPGAPMDLTTESQNAQIRRAGEALRQIPLKTLKFYDDVRPPYIGTVSGLPVCVAGLKKLARKPLARDILPLNYDYDSEAEWQEEDGEDVESDNDEDEVDEDEVLDDLIDDSDGATVARATFSSDMEPKSTGLCWENYYRQGPLATMYKYRLVFINENLEHHHSIDPFSPEYWDKPSTASGGELSMPVAAVASSTVPIFGGTLSTTGPMAPPPILTDASHTPTRRLPRDKEESLKALMRENPLLSKVGLVELFLSRDKSLKKAHVKASVDALTEKPVKGTVEKGRKWVFKADV